MQKNDIIDISWPISAGMTAYKDRHVVQITPTKEFDRDGVREALVTLGTHTGTHVDAPAHFVRDGATMGQMGLAGLVGPCVVLDLTHVQDVIMPEHVAASMNLEEKIVLLKTRNSMQPHDAAFDPHFVYVSYQAAGYFSQRGVKAVGIDYLGIERAQPGHETHTQFFNAGVAVIEGLRLAHVNPGNYFFCCLPLSMPLQEACPARAVLFAENVLSV